MGKAAISGGMVLKAESGSRRLQQEEKMRMPQALKELCGRRRVGARLVATLLCQCAAKMSMLNVFTLGAVASTCRRASTTFG